MREFTYILYLGGLIHFLILIASAMAPKVMNWNDHLATLPLMLRQMFWVYGAFIVLVIVGFGSFTLLNAEVIASGHTMGRGFCALVAIFWSARLFIQLCVFDIEPYLISRFYRLGYHMLTLAFLILISIYGYAVFRN